MEDREMPRMHKYGESKTIQILMATVPHVTSGSGLGKFQADGFLFDRVYLIIQDVSQLFFYNLLIFFKFQL